MVLDLSKLPSLFQNNKRHFYNDVVYFDSNASSNRGYYWFTGADNTFVTHTTNPTGVNSLFTRSFYFKPDLNFDVPVNPKFIKTEYDSSAPAFENYGINKTCLEFTFNYNNRSDKETEAILKFLDSNAGLSADSYGTANKLNGASDVLYFLRNYEYNEKLLQHGMSTLNVIDYRRNADHRKIIKNFVNFLSLSKKDAWFNYVKNTEPVIWDNNAR